MRAEGSRKFSKNDPVRADFWLFWGQISIIFAKFSKNIFDRFLPFLDRKNGKR